MIDDQQFNNNTVDLIRCSFDWWEGEYNIREIHFIKRHQVQTFRGDVQRVTQRLIDSHRTVCNMTSPLHEAQYTPLLSAIDLV